MSDSLAGAVALARANARYWPLIAPQAARELRSWQARAAQIGDPKLRELATWKLREEHFNAQVAAVLATNTPRSARRTCVSAIVALEVLYDYLDGLSEQEGAGEQVYEPFTAIAHGGGQDADGADRSQPDQNPGQADEPPQTSRQAETAAHQTAHGGYTAELSASVRERVRRLAAWERVRPSAAAALTRCAAAQTRIHALPRDGEAQLRDWAAPLGTASGLGWRELAAGAAASVLCAQALIAAAASPHTSREQADALDGYYLRVCALSTLLDAAGDREQDLATGALNLTTLYRDADELAAAAGTLASEVRARARQLPDSGQHLMIGVGVVAYFSTVEGANTPYGRTVREAAWRELAPLIGPTLAVIRAWRAAKRIRRGRFPRRGGSSRPPDA